MSSTFIPEQDELPDGEDLMPNPVASRRFGAGLCLSGGGYRATLFHLGATRRLNELGLLPQLRTVSSVSGGSLFAGLLASHLKWPLSGVLDEAQWQDRVGRPTRRLCGQDLRTGPILSRLWPSNWKGPGAVYGVAERLKAHYGDLRVQDLPHTPHFQLCATDLNFGVNWTFSGIASGDYQAGYLASTALDWPLALAAATSACFPPVFAPLPLWLKPEQLRRAGARKTPSYAAALQPLLLNDGGNYDNLALEPVWKTHALVLVSDGGAPFATGRSGGLLWRLLRFAGVSDRQSRSLRRRWLLASSATGVYRAVYWAVGGSVSLYARLLPPDAECLRLGYDPDVGAAIGRIRTDLNRFTLAEQAILENHGYLLADAALRAYLPEGSDWRPAVWPQLKVPHPEWLDRGRVLEALR